MLQLAVVVPVKVLVVLASSSSLAQDPRITKILPIETIKKIILFIFILSP